MGATTGNKINIFLRILTLKLIVFRSYFLIGIFPLFAIHSFDQEGNRSDKIYRPYVNQAGYNLGESKWFVCYNTPDKTSFQIVSIKTNQTVFEGRILNNEG